MHSGNYILALHTHLPWVLNHGNWPHGMDWLTEAVAECYVPLLNVINELSDENISCKLTIDISPVLCEQLEHIEFPKLFNQYCKDKVELAKKDEINFTKWGWDAHHIYLTQFWQSWYLERLKDFQEKYNFSIIKAFKKLQDKGLIEIATCAATHGYLPLLPSEKSINLQIKLALENYKKHFNREPRGIWLPECAYRPSYEWQSLIPIDPYHHKKLRPGIEQFLAKYNINYFFTDQNLTDRANPIGLYMTPEKEKFDKIGANSYKGFHSNFENMSMHPFHTCSSEKVEYGSALTFTRHREIAMQVWSGEIGYPGEPDYLDFHKKHMDSMLRYWRVTDVKADMQYKALYHPDWINKKIDMQTNHFIHHIENTLNFNYNQTGRFGTLCTPFDTELFGHWWFEGPAFIKSLMIGLSHSPYVKPITASEQILIEKPREVMHLPEGSWGENNNHDVWMNEQTKWTWEVLYNNENRLNEIVNNNSLNNLNNTCQRIFKQIIKELLLLQSSDWQFLIHTKSAKDYAEQRFYNHNNDFNHLCDLLNKYSSKILLSNEDELYLKDTEYRDSCFNELDINWWSE